MTHAKILSWRCNLHDFKDLHLPLHLCQNFMDSSHPRQFFLPTPRVSNFDPRHRPSHATHSIHAIFETGNQEVQITQRKLQLFILKFYAKRKTFNFTKCWFMHRYFLKSLRIFEPYYFSEIFSHASATFRYWATSIKGILMQIWKSPYMLVSI